MNELIFNFNNQAVAKTGQGGIVDYDLYAVAKCLGYTRPVKAVHDFVERNREELETVLGRDIQMDAVPEHVVAHFLAESQTPAGKEFRKWLFYTFIPSVRQREQDLRMVTDCCVYLLRNIGKYEWQDVLALWPKHIVDEAITKTPEAYRLLGFVPPSDTGIAVHEVRQRLIGMGVFDPEGNPTPEYAHMLMEVPRYGDKSTNSRWFALSPELVRKVLAYTTPPAPVCLVLQSDSYSSPVLPRRKKQPPQTELR